MPLSSVSAYDAVLTHACPHCGSEIEKPGSFFWRKHHYDCQRCEQPVKLADEEKLKLFHKAIEDARKGEEISHFR
jgi:transposase-like protein